MVSFAQSEGYLQVGDDRAPLVVEEVDEPGPLDAAELRERLEQAEREPTMWARTARSDGWPSGEECGWEAFVRTAEGG